MNSDDRWSDGLNLMRLWNAKEDGIDIYNPYVQINNTLLFVYHSVDSIESLFNFFTP